MPCRRESKDRSLKKRALFSVVLISLMTVLSGCSFQQKYDQHVANDDMTLNSFLNDEVINYGVYKDELDADTGEVKAYPDAKTGQMVTKSQYQAYTLVDNIKLYGFWIAIVSFSIGFLTRRFVKDSVNIRRFGLLLEMAIPLVYILLAFVASYAADRI